MELKGKPRTQEEILKTMHKIFYKNITGTQVPRDLETGLKYISKKFLVDKLSFMVVGLIVGLLIGYLL